MFQFHPDHYGVRIAEILGMAGDGQRLMPLAGGRCVSEKARETIEGLDSQALFGGQPVASPEFAEAARSGLFLYLSCLDEAHKVAQDIPSTTGSYWHGIMHRQEPDFSNSAYWFRRVGQHEIFPALREAAADILPARFESKTQWDPFAFIDVCEEVHRQPDPKLEQALQEIQRVEWQLLFDFSCRKALGTES